MLVIDIYVYIRQIKNKYRIVQLAGNFHKIKWVSDDPFKIFITDVKHETFIYLYITLQLFSVLML